MDILEVKNLNYFHKSDWFFTKTQTLFDLNFSVAEGEAFGLLGANGAGKTTTIKCILDLLKNKTGSIKVFSQDSKQPGARKDLAYIPEQSYFYDNITSIESILLAGRLSGLNNFKDEIDKTLELLGISNLKNRKLRFLSKGQKQRVMLAQALVAKPKLLILDEPFSGLDPIGRKEFRDIFLSLKNSGTALILCSHILADVELICDRAAILKKGRLCGIYEMARLNEYVNKEYELILAQEVALGTEVSASNSKEYSNAKVYVFKDFTAAQKALQQAATQGVEVLSFKSIHGGLEDLFINLIKN